FGWALYILTQSTHDGHFVYIPDVVSKIFNFGRPIPLVSVSKDGKSLPEPYAYPDILASSLANATFEPSKIVKINGEDAKTYLETFSQFGSLQDRDALYNNIFYELAIVSLGSSGAGSGTFTGGGRGRWVYPGPTTELTFANGSVAQFPNFARVLVPFTGIQSGEDVYTQYFSTPANTSAGINIPNQPETTPTPTPTTASAAATPAPGYPQPVVRASNNAIGGYYLEEDGFEDVAVLSIPSFGGAGGQNSPMDFQTIGRDFVQKAKAEGKKKLIVDLSANGGGIILLGYDAFKYLFPKATAFAASDRFRIFEATDLIGKKFSDVAGQYPRTLDPALGEVEATVVADIFNYRSDQKPEGVPFTSWDDKNGPVANKGDKFTSLIRWNLSDVLTPYNGGINAISNEPVATMEQPFAAEDIVVVTDGYCASTCTIFSELMRQVAGVKYVSLGGRAFDGPSQAVGGVKGTNNLPWPIIQQEVALVYNYSTPSEAQKYDTTSLIEYNDNLPFLRAGPISPNTNFRDGIRVGDETGTPLQFVYEESDCRIFYTPEMTVDVTNIWKAVYDSAWGGQSHCVAGQLGGGYSRARKERSPVQRRVSWRRDMSIQDYPMSVFTDESAVDFTADGFMMP
ncbi:hypothetical protein EJ05DRAFT_442160, partial [Pseudovirgaria hyperparasitica]